MTLLMLFRPQDTHDATLEYVFDTLRRQYEEEVERIAKEEPEAYQELVEEGDRREDNALPHLINVKEIKKKQDFLDAEYFKLMQELQELEKLREVLKAEVWRQQMLDAQDRRAILFLEIRRLEQQIELEEFFIFCALIAQNY